VFEKVEEQLSQLEQKKKAYEEILVGMKSRRADSFRVRILEYGLTEMKLRIEWLDELRQEYIPKG